MEFFPTPDCSDACGGAPPFYGLVFADKNILSPFLIGVKFILPLRNSGIILQKAGLERGPFMEKFIKEIGNLIKKEFIAKEAILFGSFAKGECTENSDIDILVIMETKLKPYKQASLIRMRLDEKLGVKYPIDLIVRTPQQIKRRLALGDFFLKSVLAKGIRL